MHARLPVLLGLLSLAVVAPIDVRASSSGPIALAPDGAAVWAVNPDSGTVAKLATATNTRLGEFPVGRYPRTVAVTPGAVYVTNQLDDSVSRLAPDGTPLGPAAPLAFGCAPYGVVASGGDVYVTCEGTSALLVLDATLALRTTVELPWPEARAIAVGNDGKVYVTHYITKEPNHAGHVSEVDPATGRVTRVLAIDPDGTTCETLATGQGVANLLSAIAVVPPGAPAAVAGQLWVGGTLHNSLRKGLFERSRYFADQPGIALFPDLQFHSNPSGEGPLARRNIYKPALGDIARSLVWKLDLGSGKVVGKVDLDHGGTAAAIAFSPAGDVAHVVDLMANAYYAFATARGQGPSPVSVFGQVSAGGPGGASQGAACTGDAHALVPEDAYIFPPQARLAPINGMNPLDAADPGTSRDTGLEFTVATGLMRPVPDGVGTTPIGVVLSSDGSVAYVANYLARNVAVVNAASFVCQGAPTTPCRSRRECGGQGECMPLVRAVVRTTCSAADATLCGGMAADPLPPSILDGKILFTTSARDAAGVKSPIPPWNRLTHDGSVHQGEVTSTAREGAGLACTSCHADFGGNDGRTWDFSQFGSSLRNTMDLRGRASFAPGTCPGSGATCTTDAECGGGSHCRNNPSYIPPNIIGDANRARYFNPMGSTHWNGDRDEVEDFEFTFRELLGASDCDGVEDKPETCVGALVTRRFVADPVDVRVDLSPQPNRGLSRRLDDLGDYVYSLTAFPRNPNLGAGGASPSEAARRGRVIFDDPVVRCSFCHNGPSGANQQFTNKGPNPGYDPSQTPRADLNSPFLRFSVETMNVFDRTNPFRIASDSKGLLGFTLFQNEQSGVPGNRDKLETYITPVLVDVWNTAPYLHDGSARTLLDVVRSCNSSFEKSCEVAGLGRNQNDLHGVTSILSARQLNDLVAFEKAPHGLITEEAGVNAAALTVDRLVARFGKRPRSGKLTLRGHGTPQGTFDPAHQPVTVSIGVPAGEEMAIVAMTIPAGGLRGNRAGTVFRFADRHGTRAGGLRALAIKARQGRVAFKAGAAGLDLSALLAVEVGYTVALEVGDATLAVTRGFRTNKRRTVVKGP